jgi:hypothetical protein
LLTPLACATIRTTSSMNFFSAKPISPSKLAQALDDGEK